MSKILFALVFAFVLFCPSLASSQSFLSVEGAIYNTTLAKKFWHFCMASYCKQSKIAYWDLGFVSTLYPGVTDITVIYNSTKNTLAYTAYYPEKNEVLIIFRGTQMTSVLNWISDIDFISTAYPYCSGCRVHQGFYKAYLTIRDPMMAAIQKLYEKYPTARKLVAGHSLGGALAVHAGVDIVRNFGPVDEFYTFGQPRVGNQEFASYVNVLVPGSFNSRVTHNKDPVPHLPLLAMGFFHIDREVFYDSDGGYKVCVGGEDSSCSNYQLNVNILDHLNYMGVELLPYMIACNPLF